MGGLWREVTYTVTRTANAAVYAGGRWRGGPDKRGTTVYENNISHRLVIYNIICLKSVGVRKRQVAILSRSPREISLTDRILPRYILSRVRVSVRPIIFLYAKKPQTRVARMLFISMGPLCGQINNRIGDCRTDLAGWRRAKASGY